MTRQVVRIENWNVITHPYNKKRYLHGEVYGYARFSAGYVVTTSSLKDLRGDVAVTNSGTIYQLGERKKHSSTVSLLCLSV